MTIEENWNRLKLFWDTITFEEFKKLDEEERIGCEETLEYTQKDILELHNKVSTKRAFSPASDEEINRIEKELDVVLPDSFKQSLKINAKDPIYPFLGGWNSVLKINFMIDFSLSFKTYSISNKKWVVFFEWNMDYFAVLNLDTENLNYGEVLCVCPENVNIEKWADSYEEWFNMAVEETITYGELQILDC